MMVHLVIAEPFTLVEPTVSGHAGGPRGQWPQRSDLRQGA